MKSRNTMLSMALGALLAAATPGVLTATETVESQEIAKLASTANSPAEHVQVARKYLDLSRSLRAKAEKLEKELRTTGTGPTRAMEQKWPALMSKSREKRERDERIAMQTRRAAQESYDLARYHSKLAGRTIEQVAARD